MRNGTTNTQKLGFLSETMLSGHKWALAPALALALGGEVAASAAEIEFTPITSASITHTDNVYLTPVGEEDDTLVSLNLGIQANGETERLDASLYYLMGYSMYDTADEFNGMRHTLRGTSTFEVSPDFFFVDVNGSIQEQARNRDSVRAGTERTFGGDEVRTGTLSVRPYIQTVVASSFELLASVEYAAIWYSDTQNGNPVVLPEDRERLAGQFKIGNEKAPRNFTWSFDLRAVELDDERRDIDVLGSAFYNISGTTRLVGRVGYDQADTNGDGDNDIEETLWRVGLDMRPTPRTIFRAEVGQRYDDTTYDLEAAHAFRESFQLSASYNHRLVTDAGQFVEFSGSPIFDDQGQLIGFDDVTTDIRDDSYIMRRARVNASGIIDSLSYQLSLSYQDREFEFSPNDETVTRISGQLTYEVSDRFRVFGGAAVSDEDAFVAASETDITRYTLGASFALTPDVFLSVQGVAQKYEYATGADIEENAIVVSVSKNW